jgi:hypothetical protein
MESNDVPILELQILPKRGQKFGLLAGRDNNELEWMATRLRRSLGVKSEVTGDKVVGLPDRKEKPEKSRVVYEPLEDGLLLSVPRAGFKEGNKATWGYAILWNLILTAITTALMMAGGMQDGPFVFIFLLLSLFWCIGLAMLGMAIHMSFRTAELAASGGRLLVVRSGLLSKSKREFGPHEIACVRAVPSSISVNHQPFYELEIVPREGKSLTLLEGRDQEELAWMATILRQALRVPG